MIERTFATTHYFTFNYGHALGLSHELHSDLCRLDDDVHAEIKAATLPTLPPNDRMVKDEFRHLGVRQGLSLAEYKKIDETVKQRREKLLEVRIILAKVITLETIVREEMEECLLERYNGLHTMYKRAKWVYILGNRVAEAQISYILGGDKYLKQWMEEWEKREPQKDDLLWTDEGIIRRWKLEEKKKNKGKKKKPPPKKTGTATTTTTTTTAGGAAPEPTKEESSSSSESSESEESSPGSEASTVLRVGRSKRNRLQVSYVDPKFSLGKICRELQRRNLERKFGKDIPPGLLDGLPGE